MEALLSRLGIAFNKVEHPPLPDCQAADRFGLARPGQRIKNLFLRDNYGRQHILLLTTPDKQVDLKALSRQSGLSRLGFASAERLERYLGVAPGAVSLLALAQAPQGTVALWIDEALWQGQDFQCHPLVSHQTLVIPKTGVERFCDHLGIIPKVLAVPSR
ncbi:prolyl-tRNA synthetase associated domain-containing protein [Gallaecimonas xiamenensis]|uniref:Ala-tRNA(Pro) hydrolase n=1 Tax=Gallaecimonas xiamenensis 3-C-1 TaxID=745411 RepID=K2JMS7_9GAMM|nr:prolyl-tRNA synthetase associated domain-containing protein [Gallaecimonas xiamenensis]EKE75717.1 Ala-tRNA(Pro) hydrolase [Gallaecimonas xiamenensis 3-C-1]